MNDAVGMAGWASVLRWMTGRRLVPPHLSFSAAETWEQCQRKWSGKYVLYVPDPTGPEADVGKMVHTVLQSMGAFQAGRRTLRFAKPIAERAWAGKTVEARRLAMGHVVRALRNLEVATGDVLGVEMDLTLRLGGVPFKGFLDRADRIPADTPTGFAARIIDYKSGKHPGKHDWLAPKFRQIYLYAAGFETVTHVPVHEGALVWTKNGRVDTVHIDEDRIGMALDWLRKTWAEIQAAIDANVPTGQPFEAHPGPLCSWCPMVTVCPEGIEAVVWRAENESHKPIGPHGQKVLDARIVDQFQATLDAA